MCIGCPMCHFGWEFESAHSRICSNRPWLSRKGLNINEDLGHSLSLRIQDYSEIS